MEPETIAGGSHYMRFINLKDHQHHPGSSESAPSDYDSIYNAIKADLGTEDYGRRCGSIHQTHWFQGSEMGGNLAMVISASPEISALDSPTEQKETKLHFRRSQTLPDNWLPSKSNVSVADIVKDAKSKVNTLRRRGRRRSLSLGDADNRSRKSKWAANLLSPVKPFLPRYPPPARSPTPPGVPSFGTPEAISYTTQFCVRSSIPNSQDLQLPPFNREPSGRTAESYLRRIFRVSSSGSQSNRRPPLARAEDGTAVQGRFPYRASGHGMNLARRLEDHPFNRAASPIFESESANMDMGGSPYAQGGHRNTAKGQSSMLAGSQNQRFDRTPRPPFSNVRSSLPTPVTGNPSRRPVPLLPPLASPASTPYYSSISQPQSSAMIPMQNGDISLPGAGRTCGPMVNIPSRLQPSARAVRPAENNAMAEETPDAQEPGFWMGSRSDILAQYFCCCCSTDDDEDEDNDGAASGHGSRSSGDTYRTARSWPENNTADNGPQYSSPENPRPRNHNTQSSRNTVFTGRRHLISLRSFLATEPMLA